MCNVKIIQSHLFSWCGTYFRAHVCNHLLVETSDGLQISHSVMQTYRVQHRVSTTCFYFRRQGWQSTQGRARRAVHSMLYGRYVRVTWLVAKMWSRDHDVDTCRSERSRSKGSLQIILHTMFKGGWVLVRDGDGQVSVLEEWYHDKVNTCEMYGLSRQDCRRGLPREYGAMG